MEINKRSIFVVAFGLIAFVVSTYAIYTVWNGNNLTIQEMRLEMKKEKDRYKTFNGLSRLSIARMNEIKVDISYGLGVNKEAAIKSVNKLNDKIPENYERCPFKPDSFTVVNLSTEKLKFYEKMYIDNANNITVYLDEYEKDLKRVEESFESMASDCKPNIFYFNCLLQVNDYFREEGEGFELIRDTISEIVHSLNDHLKNALEISLQNDLGLLKEIKTQINNYVCCIKTLKVYVDSEDLKCIDGGIVS